MTKRYKDVVGDGGSNIAGQVAEQMNRLRARMAGVRHKIAVMSGKGGVGKSTITTNLAAVFAQQGLRVGVMDADINGPSLAKMFGVRGQRLRIDDTGVFPAAGPLGIQLISMDLFLPEDKMPVVWDGPLTEAFIWRGTLEMHALREFLSDTHWGELDILLIDLPPGTDRFSTLRDLLPDLDGSIVVTIPSAVSHLVVLKSITMAQEFLKTPVIGLIENMTAYLCPTCQEVHPLFAPLTKRDTALGVPLLGSIPFDPRMAEASDRGVPYVLEYGSSLVGHALVEVGERVKNFLNLVHSR
jgi:ATP-binding protein involved in chromosome partitioning